jgi:N-acetylglucosaminyldiphosphoundecaprenol N-acetyl-beta-D-mannosaminyltransferase
VVRFRRVPEILGVRVDAVTRAELLDFIDAALAGGRRAIVTNVNAHALNLAAEDPWFRGFLASTPLTFCDGYGVKWALRLLGQPVPERLTPPDWLGDLARRAAGGGHPVFLLGARPGVAERAAARLVAEAPGLAIAGTHHGYFAKVGPESRAVVERVNASGARVLLVGFGMPAQERWLADHWDALAVKVALPIGAAIDYLAREVARAPRFLTDHGLEWLARLAVEPGRLWRRYLVGNPRFALRVAREWITRSPKSK